AQKRRLPDLRVFVPIVSGQDSRIDEREAADRLGLRYGPPEAPSASEIMHHQMRARDAELVEQRSEVTGIAFHRVVEIRWAIRAAVAGHVHRNDPSELGSARRKPLPV